MSDATIVTLVAGGTGGLGRAVSQAFLAAGATVAVTYRKRAEFDELRRLAGADAARLSGHESDVTDDASARALVEQRRPGTGPLGCAGQHGRRLRRRPEALGNRPQPAGANAGPESVLGILAGARRGAGDAQTTSRQHRQRCRASGVHPSRRRGGIRSLEGRGPGAHRLARRGSCRYRRENQLHRSRASSTPRPTAETCRTPTSRSGPNRRTSRAWSCSCAATPPSPFTGRRSP